MLLSKRFLLLTSFYLFICTATFGFENQLIEIISKPYYLLLRFHVSRETCEAIHSPKETLQNLKSSYSASNAEDTIASSSPFSPSVWLGYFYSETALIEVSLTACFTLWSIFLYFFYRSSEGHMTLRVPNLSLWKNVVMSFCGHAQWIKSPPFYTIPLKAVV